jgi:hypothetical protein
VSVIRSRSYCLVEAYANWFLFNTLRKEGRDLGLRLDGAVHIYLSVEERDEIFNLLMESANEKAKRTGKASNQGS